MNIEQYIRNVIRATPGIVKDAMDPQILQAELAVDISDNMGDYNPNPVYPRTDSDRRLFQVKANLLRAATIYKGRGNASTVKASGTSFSFIWGIDLDVVPYARIHEFGGDAGRGLKTKIKARPYIGPAMQTFIGGTGTVNAANFTTSVEGFARIVNEIYTKLTQVK